MQVVRTVETVEVARHDREYRLKGVYSHPSKNEGWGTLFPDWDSEVKGWATRPKEAAITMNFRLIQLIFYWLSLASILEWPAIAQTSEEVARHEAVSIVRSGVGLRPEQFLDVKRDEGLEELLIVSAGRRIPLVFMFKLSNSGYEFKNEKIVHHTFTEADLLYVVAISSVDGSAYLIRGFPNSASEFGKLMAASKVKLSSSYQAEALADFYREVNPERTFTTPITNLMELKQAAERQCQISSFDTGEQEFDTWWKKYKHLYAGLQFAQTAKSNSNGYVVEWTVLSSSGTGMCGGAALQARLDVSSDAQVVKLSFSPYGRPVENTGTGK